MVGCSRPPLLQVLTEYPGATDSVNGDDLVWNAAHETGFLVITFDTATRKRREILANPRLATLHGMHHEELLSRMAGRDLPLPATPLDGLLAALFITVRDAFSTGAPAELYGRMSSGSRGLLFCSRSVAAFDANGRLAEVPPPFPRRVAQRKRSAEHTEEILLNTFFNFVWNVHYNTRS